MKRIKEEGREEKVDRAKYEKQLIGNNKYEQTEGESSEDAK